jgi:hypothetical protein
MGSEISVTLFTNGRKNMANAALKMERDVLKK